MRKTGMTLIEVVVSMLVLAVAALAVAATISLVNSRQMRSAGGGSLDLQALSFARQTLESLKNAVSTDGTRNAHFSLTTHDAGSDPDPTFTRTTLPPGDFLNHGGTRSYVVSDVPGTGSGLNALKQVTVTVTWND